MKISTGANGDNGGLSTRVQLNVVGKSAHLDCVQAAVRSKNMEARHSCRAANNVRKGCASPRLSLLLSLARRTGVSPLRQGGRPQTLRCPPFQLYPIFCGSLRLFAAEKSLNQLPRQPAFKTATAGASTAGTATAGRRDVVDGFESAGKMGGILEPERGGHGLHRGVDLQQNPRGVFHQLVGVIAHVLTHLVNRSALTRRMTGPIADGPPHSRDGDQID